MLENDWFEIPPLISEDGEFIIEPSTHTITKEEVPQLLMAVANILRDAATIATAIMTRNVIAVGSAAVDIYNQVKKIKEIVES